MKKIKISKIIFGSVSDLLSLYLSSCSVGRSVSTTVSLIRLQKITRLLTILSEASTMAERDFNFIRSHEVTFGLKISDKHLESNIATSVVCRFCSHYGRDDVVGAKRKKT